MIPKVRDAIPTIEENYLYNIVHNFNAGQLYTFMHEKTMMAAGDLIGIFLSGAAVVLGFSSISLFSSHKGACSGRYYFLCAYTTVLLLLLLLVEILAFINGNYDVISFFWSFSKTKQHGSDLTRVIFTMLVLVIALTDGLLVWRCFLVQRVLARGSPKWYNIFWIFPASLYTTTMAMGAIATMNNSSSARFAVIALASNITLNIHATLFITIRLLIHRRMVIACVQDKSVAAQHIYIVGILLESAAVNLPVTIVTAVSLGSVTVLKVVMLPIFTASQVLAAILIIHQTALGRVFSQQKETEISKLVETGERGSAASTLET